MKLLQFNKENPGCFETWSVDSPLSTLLNTLSLEPHNTPLETAFDVRPSMVSPAEPQNQNHPNKQGRSMKVGETKQHTIRVGKSKMKGARHRRERLVIGSKEQYNTLLSLQEKSIVSKWRRQEIFSSISTTCVRSKLTFVRS
jgi:hypothetical protein